MKIIQIPGVPGSTAGTIQDPPIARALFSDTRWAWIWVLLRVYVGYQWLQAGITRIGDPAWMQTGAALKGYWTGAVAIPASASPPSSAPS